MNPEISVVMAVQNEEKYLDQAIESILEQTYANFEFIIVDDASTDKTPEILQKFKELDSRIIVLHNEKPLRLPGSLNRGIEIAKGKWIARMDGDDISLPTRFQEQIEYLRQHANINILSTWVTRITPKGEKIVDWTMPEEHSLLIWRIPFTTPVYHASAIMHTQFIKSMGMYDPDAILEDIDLWSRVAPQARFGCVPKSLYLYRDSEQARADKAEFRVPIANEIRRKFIESLVPYPVSMEMYEDFSQSRIKNSAKQLKNDSKLKSISLLVDLYHGMKYKNMLIVEEETLVFELLSGLIQNLLLHDVLDSGPKYKSIDFWKDSGLPRFLQIPMFALSSPKTSISFFMNKVRQYFKKENFV